jgi:tetratricopeptide (TPR) repeat protein
MRRRARRLVVFLLTAWTVAVSAHAIAATPLEELLDQAARLAGAGEAAEAYALLAGQEDTYLGDVKFDYALGRAALDAGFPARATLAFARVLAVQPNHAGARIDSGRAYLALGNREQAAAAFQALLELDPPPALRAQLLVYLAEARRERTVKLAARGYLSAYTGVSSNVNQAPGQGQIFVPGLLAFLQLSDQNVRKGDSYVGVAGGVEAARQLAGQFSLIGSAEFAARENAHESDFDVGGAAGSIGMAWAGERHVIRAQVQGVVNTLGGRTSRRVQALSLDATERTVAQGAPGIMFAFLQVGQYRYTQSDLKVFDADFATVGVGANLQFDGNSTVSVALLAGGDTDRGGNPSGDRRGLGIRLSWERPFGDQWRVVVQGGAANSKYDGFDPSFLTEREDRGYDAELSVRYAFSRDFEVRLGALRVVQSSNIPIYEFARTDFLIGLRKRFD